MVGKTHPTGLEGMHLKVVNIESIREKLLKPEKLFVLLFIFTILFIMMFLLSIGLWSENNSKYIKTGKSYSFEESINDRCISSRKVYFDACNALSLSRVPSTDIRNKDYIEQRTIEMLGYDSALSDLKEALEFISDVGDSAVLPEIPEGFVLDNLIPLKSSNRISIDELLKRRHSTLNYEEFLLANPTVSDLLREISDERFATQWTENTFLNFIKINKIEIAAILPGLFTFFFILYVELYFFHKTNSLGWRRLSIVVSIVVSIIYVLSRNFMENSHFFGERLFEGFLLFNLMMLILLSMRFMYIWVKDGFRQSQ